MSDAGRGHGRGIDLPDLDAEGSDRRPVSVRTVLFLAWLSVLVAGFCWDLFVLGPRDTVVFGWTMAVHEWLFVLSLSVFLFYVVVPLARRPTLTRYYWDRLREDRVGTAAFCYLVGFFVVGMLGPAVVGVPKVASVTPPHQPPVGVGVDARFVATCAGQEAMGKCWGTLANPLGTDGNGRDLVVLTVNGARLALEVAFVSAALLVPLATAVGTLAAEAGGRVEEVLMRFVDLQQIVPAFFVYVVAQYVYAPRFSLLLLVFGLLSWGSVARMVRSEAVGRRDLGYVRAAESAGAGHLFVVRHHVVPNVMGTVVAAVTLQIPTLVLLEAALSFLALGDPRVFSFGQTISVGIGTTAFPRYWWVSTVPGVVLVVTVVALNLLGDALGDVLDPRVEG